MSAKIVNLDIQNVMRIKAVHIEPNGNVVVLGGRNAQGKTSVLDAISVAIGGMKLCPEVPIREGQDEAEITLQLGEMLITRKFKRKGDTFTSSLVVKNAEGQPLSPPQKTLDALIGRLAFDPLEFARMSPAGARETLRELVGLDVEQLEDELGRVYRQRTEAGIAKRAAQAVVDELPVPPAFELPVSVDGVMAEMRAAGDRRAEFEELKGIAERSKYNYDTAAARVTRLREELGDAEASVTKYLNSLAMADNAIKDFVAPDLDEIQGRFAQAQEHNTRAERITQERNRYAEKAEQAAQAAEAWKALDAEHNQIAYKIKKMTEAVTYPIEDMELRPEGVFYQGVPFEQGSRAERIKVSLAMGMAMNDKLRILLIRDGSVLDKESMATIAKLAEEQDFQFWIEMARGYEGAAGAIVIEDGGVV